jgi:hypothetical protein
MFSCRRASHLISDRSERPLSTAERLSLRVHLLGCWPCRRFRRAIRWLDRALASSANDATLPPETRERIQRALERARSAE